MSRPLLAEYVRAGWALVPIPHDQKGPVAAGWNLRERAITDEEVAEWMDGNVGLAHAYSGTCCVDLDDLETATAWLAERGIDIPALLAAPESVMISSGRENRAKLLYHTAKPLPSFKLEGFELRCASSTGKTVQDVLPPSIHPDTGKPYEWKYGDDLTGHWSIIPELPREIRVLWESLITPETSIKTERPEKIDPNTIHVREVLAQHNPDADYDTWVKVGMALHHEFDGATAGLALWDEWSSKGKKYKGKEDLHTHWRSFNSNVDNPRTMNSLRVETAAEDNEFQPIAAELITAAEVQTESVAKGEKQLPANLAEAVNQLRRDKSGMVLSTLPNILTILGIPPVTGNVLAYDSFKDDLLCAPNGTEEWRQIRDTDYTAIRLWLENVANFYPVSKDMVRDSVHYLAEANTMDSAQLWLSSLTWDGTKRIERFLPAYMGTIDAKYERAVGFYLWTALAGRVMEPGCQVDMVPILVGTQGLGKSQGVKALAPSEEFYTEIRLDETDDDIARKMRGTLVGELAELRGLRTADSDRIKAFVTRTREKWTPKYKEFATTFARRLVMIGTTNEDDFLADDENRRWLPVKTMGVDVEGIKRDRDQLWAEALQVWMANGVMWKDAELLGRDNQDEFKATDAWDGLISQWLNENPEQTQLRIHDVLLIAVGMDSRHVNRSHELRVAKILKSRGFVKVNRRENGRQQKVWVMPRDTVAGEPAEEFDPAS